MKPVRVRPHTRSQWTPGIDMRTGEMKWIGRDPAKGNAQVQALASAYNSSQGLAPPQYISAKAQPETQRLIADAYEALPKDDPRAHIAYQQFAEEIDAQYEFVIANSDIRFEFGAADPYTNSAAMMDDVRENRRLKVFTGGEPHPFLSAESNNRFRAVHDLFGHAAWGHQFGPSGEMSAYFEHEMMFTPLARRAMATETLGQNSYYNYSKENEGKPHSERKFAEQKAALLPEHLVEEVHRNQGTFI